MLLLTQSLSHVALLVRCCLQLGEYHIEPFHEADLLRLQLLKLICQARVSVIDLAAHAKVVLVGSLTGWQGRVDWVAGVSTVS